MIVCVLGLFVRILSSLFVRTMFAIWFARLTLSAEIVFDHLRVKKRRWVFVMMTRMTIGVPGVFLDVTLCMAIIVLLVSMKVDQ